MIFLITLVICLLSLVGLMVTYRKYLGFMRKFYREEWRSLLNKDPFVGGLGEESRWLHGPVVPFISILNLHEDYEDPKIRRFKKSAVAQMAVIIISLMVLILMPLLTK